MTYNPVKTVSRPKTGLFSGLPSAAPGTVLVVDREGHPVRVLQGPGDRLTAGEVRWGGIRTLYEVDVTEHQLEFRESFPCRDDIGGFQATVILSCVVTDPAAVVVRGISDVARVLIPRVTETLRQVCGQFSAEDYQQAEQVGRQAIYQREAGPGHDRAFRIRDISIVLALDESAAVYIHERKETARNRVRQQDAARLDQEKARLEAELGRTRSQLEAELARTRDQMESERVKAAAQIEHERLRLETTRQQLEGRLADQQQELELARAAVRAKAEQQGANDLELQRLDFERIRIQRQAELDAEQLTFNRKQAQLQADYDRYMLESNLERDRIQVTQLTELLSRGQFAALAMRLAQDPEAIGPVSNFLANQRAADINRQLRALELLMENDGLEGWQITDQARTVLRQLISNWSEHSGQAAVAAESPAAEIEAGTPGADRGPGEAVADELGSSGSPGDNEFFYDEG